MPGPAKHNLFLAILYPIFSMFFSIEQSRIRLLIQPVFLNSRRMLPDIYHLRIHLFTEPHIMLHQKHGGLVLPDQFLDLHS